MKTFTVKGTNFNIGVQLGKKLKKEIAARLKVLKITSPAVAKQKSALELIHHLCLRKFPFYVEELQGYSQGSGIDYWQLLLLNCPELGTDHGCSSIVVNTKEQTLLAHNEDAANAEKKQYCALVKFVLPKVTFHSYVYAGELAGNAFSWNSQGVYVAVNYLHAEKKKRATLPSYFTARALCEARELQQAVEILRRGSSVLHYFIGKKDRLISVEQWQEELSLIDVKGQYFHTSHYIHGKFTAEISGDEHSFKRYERMKELMGSAPPLTILFDTKNRPYSIYSQEKDVKRTLATVVFYPLQKKVRIYESKKKFKEFGM
ncbi:hypothetical protein HYX14_06090 [Candidatus Woesearchaeota archaeon]|nr:hypothetical protein [Candidatus Woesearchaeota archaeon]